MERRFIDTNIFLRYLTKDDASRYDRCRKIFKDVIEGKTVLMTSGQDYIGRIK